MIRNVWRWIQYYWGRKKIYRKDGTVLMPSIRSYDLLDCAIREKQAGKVLRWPSVIPASAGMNPSGNGSLASAAPARGMAVRLRELCAAMRRSHRKQVSQRGRLRNASMR
jgi:hypothetical protein